MTDLWFDYIPVRIRGGRKFERLYLFIRYKSAEEMESVRQLHAQKSARNEEVPRRSKVKKAAAAEKTEPEININKPFSEEITALTVAKLSRLIEGKARLPELRGVIGQELYDSAGTVVIYLSRLLTNTSNEKKTRIANETRDALNRILERQGNLQAWLIGMASMMKTLQEQGRLKSPQYNSMVVYNAMEDITILPLGQKALHSAGQKDKFKPDLTVFDE